MMGIPKVKGRRNMEPTSVMPERGMRTGTMRIVGRGGASVLVAPARTINHG